MPRATQITTTPVPAVNPTWFHDLYEILFRNNILSLSSSLAYYTILALTPFLLLTFAAMSFIGWHNFPDLQHEIVETMGPSMEMAFLSIQSRLQDSGAVIDFGVFTLLTFVLSSMGFISELQSSLSLILVGTTENEQQTTFQAIKEWLETRALGLLALIFCVFVVLGSFALAIAFKFFIQAQNEAWWEVTRFIASYLVFSGVFFFLFRYMPIKKQSIGFAARAGVICSSLFHIGKYLIESYFLRIDMTKGYGALSSFVVLLLWAYYNALIILFSACVAKALFATLSPYADKSAPDHAT